MEILEGIEKLSKAVKELQNEVRQLKLLASNALQSTPSTVREEFRQPDDQLRLIVGYLTLGQGIEQDELLNNVLSCAQQVVRAEGAGLTLYDDQRDTLTFRAATGVAADQIIGWEVPLVNSQHGIAFRMRQAISSTPMNRMIDQVTGVTYRNVLIAPLLVNDDAIGTISAVNKIGEDHFTPDDIEAYTGFAELAAHIIRQRVREYNLRQIIEGEAANVPRELAGVKGLTDDTDFLDILRSIVEIERRSPELIPLCRQIIGALAEMG
jgi:GAF domain-containing protein